MNVNMVLQNGLFGGRLVCAIRSLEWRPEHTWLALVLLSALVLRVTYVYLFQLPPAGDPDWYDETAVLMLKGYGYAVVSFAAIIGPAIAKDIDPPRAHGDFE